jgi:tight adherence protein C
VSGSTLLLVGGLVAIFIALVIMISLLAVGHRVTPVERGIATIGQAYSPIPQPGEGGVRPVPGQAMGGTVGGVARVLTPRVTAGWIQRQLDYAGNPPNWPVNRVHEVQGIAALVVMVLGTLVGAALDGIFGALVGLVFGTVIGLGVPLIIVYDLATRRQEQIQRELPDALDLLTLCVEAGQGFDGALTLVSTRMSGPLSREIARALQEIAMGMRRVDAIRGIGARTSVTELRSFCTAVIQAGDLGIPIANVLREQAEEMRLKRRQHADEKARKVPVKLVIPLVFMLLPAIFLVVLGPAVLQIIRSGLFSH